MKNRARAALLVAACVVALTGCVKLDADLKVNSNETVSGDMTLGVDKKLAQQSGQSLEKIRQSIEEQIKKTTTDGVKCDAYEDDKFVGTKCSLDGVSFSEMSGSSSGGVKFEKSGEKFIVSSSGGGDDLGKIPGGSQPEINFKITMPGKIVENDPGAKVDGRTATYTDATKLSSVRLVSEAGGGFPLWAIILIAVLLLGVIGAVLFFVLRGRKAPDQQQYGQYPGQQYGQYPGQPPPPQGYGQPGQQQGWGQQPGQQQQPGYGQPGQQQYPPQPPQQQGWGQQPGQQQQYPPPQQYPPQQYPPQPGQQQQYPGQGQGQGWGQDPDQR